MTPSSPFFRDERLRRPEECSGGTARESTGFNGSISISMALKRIPLRVTSCRRYQRRLKIPSLQVLTPSDIKVCGETANYAFDHDSERGRRVRLTLTQIAR